MEHTNGHANSQGLDAVRAAINAAPVFKSQLEDDASAPHNVGYASIVAGPDDPIPLVRPMAPPDPYPAAALGTALAAVVKALHDVVQSPLAMCANTLLATTTLAAQAHIDIELPFGGGARHPVSMMFVSVGRSGERKSATDEQIMEPVKDREKALRAIYDLEKLSYKNALASWEAGKKQAQGNKDALARLVDLAALGPEPEAPLMPIIVMAEPTIEGLAKLLMNGQPSVGVFSTEGGQFVGGHAMSDDAKLRSAAALSNLWDGEAWKRVRSIDGAHTIADKRLSMHLMLQPEVAGLLVSDPVLRDQGLASRLLVTYPETTMGTRFHRPASPNSLAEIVRFNARLAERLAIPYPLQPDRRNDLDPRAIRFSAEARRCWFEFADHVEGLLAPGRQLEPISGFAAKMPEHAARLAAVIAWWDDPGCREIGAATLAGAFQLIEHYGDEALRLYQAAGVTGDTADAQRLLDWLTNRWDQRFVSVTDIIQLGPNSVRVASHARKIVGILEEHRWVVPEPAPVIINGNRRREAWRIVGSV